MRTKECVITPTATKRHGLLYNYEVRDENGEMICHGGPVSKSLAKHNAKTLGAKLVERFSPTATEDAEQVARNLAKWDGLLR